MKQIILSPTKANSLFWLGRYTERIYLELHLLRLCFDKMIDGAPEDYSTYLESIGNYIVYPDLPATRNGLVHDINNPVSVLSCIERANDNAVILRDEIMSPTLAYIQMCLEKLRNTSKTATDTNVEDLQQLTDWILAFWGSVEERVYDPRVRNLLRIGKLVEHIDMNIRFCYKFYRIEEAFVTLLRCYDKEPRAFNERALNELKILLTEELYNPKDSAYLNKVLSLLGNLVTL